MNRFISLLLFIGLPCGQDGPNPERFKKNPESDRVSIDLFQEWDKKNTVPQNPIVFIGSSSIRKWPTAEYFPNMPIINRGFGGSHISDVNHYINETVLKYKPRIIVFYAGDNDIAYGKTPESILDDYDYFVKNVHTNLSYTKIIFIPIKPSPRRLSYWPKMKEANNIIYNYTTKNPLLYYVDTSSPMLDNNGIPIPSLYVNDSLHLSNDGYVLWSGLLESIM
tara:strand:- start:2724 stop:3389 length:666 start_codon:yes stop_codon:yes gene_type:complete